MQRDFSFRRRAVLTVLGILLAADVGLGIYSWQLASAPQTSQVEFDKQNLQLKLLRGDIQRAQSIRDDMPKTRKDCDKFEQSLPAASTGDSVIYSELYDIARKAGLQIVSLANKQNSIQNRGLAEIGIEATVSGEYGSVIRFVNDLQRSPTFYILDGLALSSDTQNQRSGGAIRVALHIRTYLREAA
ncbi:MAG TPA: type 4a pilus biogenesis protein PilO [Candidatus Methylomirabilis sp.]|nr:type 4a pilus biogenesis protein PilO [Candidatus Methylomirabilis sp.]